MTETVLVTGASGLLGHALMAALRRAGARAAGLSRADADLTDPAATEAAFARHRPALVFHLAGHVRGIMGNARSHGEAYRDNVRINTNVVEAARLVGARKVVAMGSVAVYGDGLALPVREEDVWAGPPHGSEAGYAHAKRGLLAQLDAYHEQYGLDFAYCLSTNLYGPHDRFDEQGGHVIPSLVSKFHHAAATGGVATVWGTGAARRDFLHVDDAAAALLRIAAAFTGPINLATGESVSIRETAELIAELSGYRREIGWDASKPDGQALRQYDMRRLQALGVRPRVSLRDGLQATLAWYAENVATVRR